MTSQFDNLFEKYARLYGLDPDLLKAQAIAESDLDPQAVSDCGAQGIAQFMPATFHEWAAKLGIENADPFNPDHAIHAQAGYMQWLKKHFDDTWQAIAAYNWGVGHMLKIADQTDWMNHVPTETHAYVDRIKRLFFG